MDAGSDRTADARRDLEGRFAGRLVGPADEGYDELRTVFNAIADHHPALIACCTSTDDVVAALGAARAHGLPISVRGAGHDVAGRGVCDDGMVLDVRGIDQVEVDPDARTVDVGGGATWAPVNDATHAHGLATTSAALSGTGVAGVALGGGFGWMLSSHGYCCDNIVGAEVVLADGQVVWADADQHPDLFWALRGAGANFGVVTRLRLACHPLTEAYAGTVAVDIDDAEALFSWYLDATPGLPDGVMAYVILAPSPSGGHMALLQLWDSTDAGTGEALADEVRALGLRVVLDQCGVLPYPAINQLLDRQYPPGRRSIWRSTYVTSLDDAMCHAIVAHYRRTPTPANRVLVQHVHGAGCRVPVEATAFVHREPGYNVLFSGDWAEPADDDPNRAWLDQVLDVLAPVRRGAVYVNYLDAGEDHRVPEAYGPVWERLRQVKATYDPTNTFRSNPNVPPAAPSDPS